MAKQHQTTVYKQLQIMHLLIDKNIQLLDDLGCESIPHNTVSVFINDMRWCISKLSPAKLINTNELGKYGFKYQINRHRRQRLVVIEAIDMHFIITMQWTQHGRNTRDSFLSDLQLGILEWVDGIGAVPVDDQILHEPVKPMSSKHLSLYRILSKACEDLANAPSMGFNKIHYGQVLLNWLCKLGPEVAPKIDTHKERSSNYGTF